MKQDRHYLAFDLGASSGRAILGSVRDGRLGPRWAAAWAASPASGAVLPAAGGAAPAGGNRPAGGMGGGGMSINIEFYAPEPGDIKARELMTDRHLNKKTFLKIFPVFFLISGLAIFEKA